MAIEAVKRYLNQNVQDYNEGRLLFDRFSENKVLKLLFKSGNSSYHHRRLLNELRAIADKTVPVLNESPQGNLEKKSIPDIQEFDVPHKFTNLNDFSNLPDQIQEVVRKKNMHFKRAQQLFIEIGFTEDKDRRLEMALVLLDDHQEVNACWAVIDEYKETGKILFDRKIGIEAEINLIPEFELQRHIVNIRSNLSKDKNKIPKLPEGSKKAKVLLRFQTNQLKLDLLLKRLEDING